MKLNNKQITEYLLRCYTALDGLWFVNLEEKCGFDTAMDIDYAVWKAMPKIQARMLKSMVNPRNGIEALFDCLTTMLTLEGYTFNTEKTENPHGFRIIIGKCPWFDLLVKAGREDVAEKVGANICSNHYAVWASEFGDNIKFEAQSRLCQGGDCCRLQFSD
ncbi:DUF6125 family protein [Chloroflexota bacterium]